MLLNDCANTLEALDAIKANWNVIEVPLIADLSGVSPELRENLNIGERRVVDSHKQMLRGDTLRPLSIMGSNYHPLQNQKAVAFLDPFLSQKQCTLHEGGLMKGGAVLWVQVKLTDRIEEVIAGDPVEGKLMIANSHNGDLGVSISFTNQQVICMNTLFTALSRADRKGKLVTLRHSKGMEDEMFKVQKAIDMANRSFGGMMEEYRGMAKTPMNLDSFKIMLENAFKIAPISDLDLGLDLDNAKEAQTLEKMRATNRLYDLFEGKAIGSDLPHRRDTVWQGMSALTEYLDHERGRDETRQQESLVGEGSRIRTRAHEFGMTMVKEYAPAI